MATTVPMLAPDGTSGEIPQDKVQAAMQSGFKKSVSMTSPDGKSGWIPEDRVQDAAKAGFKMSTPAPQRPMDTMSAAPSWGDRALSMIQHPLSSLESASVPVQRPRNASTGEMLDADLANVAAPIAGAIRHPLRTIGNVLQSIAAPPWDNAPHGPTIEQVAHEANTNGPQFGANLIGQSLLGAAVGKVLPSAETTANAMRTVGTGASTGAAVVGDTLSGAGSAIADKVSGIKGYLRPTSSPYIVPRAEMAARQLSAAIIPAGKDAPNFIGAAQQEVPNIIQYARLTGNPLNTQLEFSKAAQGYAQQMRDVYENDVLGPVQNQLVKTTKAGFGSRMNEGPDTYATLGEIDNRIVQLNKQLDAPAANADDSRRALASRIELENEAKTLKGILHSNLSEASGLTPEEVADLRQRVGRSYELANDTNAAVTQRMQEAGKADLKPITPIQLPSRAMNFVRGNQVNIADRQFQRALSNFADQPKPLPIISGPAPLPSAPIDRLEQMLSIARKQQEALRTRD